MNPKFQVSMTNGSRVIEKGRGSICKLCHALLNSKTGKRIWIPIYILNCEVETYWKSWKDWRQQQWQQQQHTLFLETTTCFLKMYILSTVHHFSSVECDEMIVVQFSLCQGTNQSPSFSWDNDLSTTFRGLCSKCKNSIAHHCASLRFKKYMSCPLCIISLQ